MTGTMLQYYDIADVWKRYGRPDLSGPIPDPTGDDFVVGTTMPTDDNTGLSVAGLTEADLTTIAPQTGQTTITLATDGHVYNNMKFTGWVIITAKDIIMNNCFAKGHPTANTGGNYGVITSTAVPNDHLATFNACRFQPSNPKYFVNCIKGGGIFNRCRSLWGVDHYNSGTNLVKCYGCYGSDHAFFDGSTGSEHSSDGRLPGWTHNDFFEGFAGIGHEFVGCRSDMYFSNDVGTPATAKAARASGNGSGYNLVYPLNNYGNAFTMAARDGNVGMSIRKHWFRGGEVCVQCPKQNDTYSSGNSLEIRDAIVSGDVHSYSQGGNRHEIFRYTAGMVGSVPGLTDTNTNHYDNTALTPVAQRGLLVAGPTNTSAQPTWSYVDA